MNSDANNGFASRRSSYWDRLERVLHSSTHSTLYWNRRDAIMLHPSETLDTSSLSIAMDAQHPLASLSSLDGASRPWFVSQTCNSVITSQINPDVAATSVVNRAVMVDVAWMDAFALCAEYPQFCSDFSRFILYNGDNALLRHELSYCSDLVDEFGSPIVHLLALIDLLFRWFRKSGFRLRMFTLQRARLRILQAFHLSSQQASLTFGALWDECCQLTQRCELLRSGSNLEVVQSPSVFPWMRDPQLRLLESVDPHVGEWLQKAWKSPRALFDREFLDPLDLE